MNKYIDKIIFWYDSRNMREKLLVLAMACAFIYACFSLLFFQDLADKKQKLKLGINENQNHIKTWKFQISTVKKIPQSSLYKEWLNQSKSLTELRGKYEALLRTSPTQQWQEIVTTILKAQNNITLIAIKNFPEADYNPTGIANLKTKIYQQKLNVVINANYFDAIRFLQNLETELPSLHWENLNYTVTQYPIAKVAMEFSIIYEKT